MIEIDSLIFFVIIPRFDSLILRVSILRDSLLPRSSVFDSLTLRDSLLFYVQSGIMALVRNLCKIASDDSIVSWH